MIDFRYHIVSIVAVFLALALGLFLGSTTLQGAVLGNIRQQVHSANLANSRLQQQYDQQRNRATRDEDFINAVAPFAVENRLNPVESVAIVSLPGVDGSTGDAVSNIVQAAHGTVASQVQLQPGFIDPSSQQQALLESLANRLRPPHVRLPAGGTGSQRAAAELAAVLASKPGRPQVSPAHAQSVLSAFTDAHLISVTGPLANVRPAALTVELVPGPGAVGAGNQQSVATTSLSLAHDLASASVGSVLAGPLSAAEAANGLLQDEQGSATRPGNLATVRAVDTTGGQVAVVFALVEVFDGRSGDFGPTDGSGNPLPSPSPTP